MLKGIKFASVPVRDQDRSLAFFVEKLGFRVITDQPFDDTQRWIELGLDGRSTRLVLFTPPDEEHRIGTLKNVAFWSDDVAATYELLSKRGVRFTGPPMAQDWGSAAVFEDPDGNTFVVSSR